MFKLSVSIVVYKPDLDVLVRALRSLHNSISIANKKILLESTLHIIDNSCDTSWSNKIQLKISDEFPENDKIHSEIIISPDNGGYGKANNLSILRQTSDYHLVMNPDVYLDSDAIVHAIEYMQENQNVGLLVPDVRGEDGARHFLCKRNPSLWIMFLRGFGPVWLKHIFRNTLINFEMRDHDYEKEIDGVKFPTGCFMFFRNSFLQQLGGFDQKFFMYLEDADIGRRMLKIASVRYVPSVRIIHRWARGTHNNWRLRWVTIESAFIYWKKWGGFFSAS